MSDPGFPRDLQALRLSLRQARALLDAQAELRRVAEAQATAARRELERVAEALCPGPVDELRKHNPNGLEGLEPRQIADMVIAAVRRERHTRCSLLVAGPHRATSNEPPATRSEQPATSHRLPATSNQPPPSSPRDLPPWRNVRVYDPPDEPAVPVESWPEWARSWREADPKFERSADILLILGDTGLARRQDVVGLVAARWEVTPGSGSIGRGLKRVAELGLVEPIRVRREGSWKPGHMLRLTERGRDAYRLITGKDPAASQATQLLNRHKSPEHAALNLEAAELLWAAGYEVELFPEDVPVEGGTYRPDLVARLGDVTLYVECERGTAKKGADRARKWELYYRASRSHFAIITPSQAATQQIGREVLAWAGARPLTLWMTDLERAGERCGEGVLHIGSTDVWLVRHAWP